MSDLSEVEEFEVFASMNSPTKLSSAIESLYVDFLEDYSARIISSEYSLGTIISDNWNYNAEIPVDVDPMSEVTDVESPDGLPGLVSRIDLSFPQVGDVKKVKPLILLSASYISEVDFIVEEARSKFYPKLALFAEVYDRDGNYFQPNNHVEMITDFLPTLIDLSDFISHTYDVGVRIFHSLLNASKVGVSLPNLAHALGRLLLVLYTLDRIVGANEGSKLVQSWKVYKEFLIKQKKNAPVTSLEELSPITRLEQMYLYLDRKLFSGTIFERFFSEDVLDYGGTKSRAALQKRHSLRNFSEISDLSFASSRTDGTSFFKLLKFVYLREGESEEGCLVSMMLLRCFYAIKQTGDKRVKSQQKFITSMCSSIVKKFPIIKLYGIIQFDFDEYVYSSIAGLADGLAGIVSDARSKSMSDLEKNSFSHSKLKERFFQLSRDLILWVTLMDKRINRREADDLNKISVILENGVKLAQDINRLMEMIILSGFKLTKKKLLYFSYGAELLSLIANTLTKRRKHVLDLFSPISVLNSLNLSKKISETFEKKATGAETRFLFNLALELSKEQLDDQHFTVIRECLCVLSQKTKTSVRDILEVLKRGHYFYTHKKVYERLLDPYWIYWNVDLFPTFLEEIFENPGTKAGSLVVLTRIMTDIGEYYSQNSVLGVEESRKRFKKKIFDMINESIIKPLSITIEDDLRFQVHSSLNVQERNPYKVASGKGLIKKNSQELRDFSFFFTLPPILIFDDILIIRHLVASYLDKTFYNLSIYHDWKVYNAMRTLAYEKYHLVLLDVYLPSDTKSEKKYLDVLSIMRQIQFFVLKYRYNLNSQIFIEIPQNNAREKRNKVKLVTIPMIAESIGNHGLGIMNTTINVSFQLLKQKFQIFTGVLSDEFIISLLVAVKNQLVAATARFREEAKLFHTGLIRQRGESSKWSLSNDNGSSGDSKTKYKSLMDLKERNPMRYKFSWAENLLKKIKRLKRTEREEYYMAKFRQLITSIGNAMAYIRIVRAGGIRFVSNSAKFIPDITETVIFKEACETFGLSKESIESGEIFDNAVKTLTSSLGDGSNYFTPLVQIFNREFSKDKYKDTLGLFYLIVPPLTIDYVSYMVSIKDKMGKAQTSGGGFSDDGFIIGLAYILKVLNQEAKFDGLGWFTEVEIHYSAEKRRLEQELRDLERRIKKKKGSRGELNTVIFKIKTLDSIREEFLTLKRTLLSAKILFKREKEEKDEDEAERASEGTGEGETAQESAKDE